MARIQLPSRDAPLPTSHFTLTSHFHFDTSDFPLPHFRLPTSDFTLSERNSKAQLRLPARRHRIADAAERRERRLAVGLAGERAQLGTPKLARLRMLKTSTGTRARVCGPSAAHRPLLLNARSTVRRFGPDEVAAAGVAERALPAAARTPRDRTTDRACRSPPRRRRSRARSSGRSWPIAGAARRLPLRARPVGLHEHRQRLSAAHRPDAGHLPAGEQRARDRRGVPARTAGPS